VLSARGFVVDEAVERRIASCREVETLRAWIARAVTASTIDAVFSE
jgi:hypothetical protein